MARGAIVAANRRLDEHLPDRIALGTAAAEATRAVKHRLACTGLGKMKKTSSSGTCKPL
jgi:hypothetical protein